MDKKQEVERRLREYEERKQAVEHMEQALQVLTPEERLVVQMLCICPERKAAQKLCGILCVEESSVYRRKARAIKKLAAALGVES